MKSNILTWSRTRTIRMRNALARLVGGCVHCGASGTHGTFSVRLCKKCSDELTGLNAHRCGRCAILLATNDALCLDCIQSPPELRYVFAFSDYNAAIQHLIVSYKFHNMLHAAPILGDALQTALSAYAQLLRPDIIVPVPQTDAHTRSRGFVPLNHLLRQIDLQRLWPEPPSLAFDATIRLHHDTLQISSTPSQRRDQIKDAFAVTQDFTGLQVLLIDDVFTTGATLNELAKTCLNAGAKNVDALVLARTRKVE